MSFTRPDYLVSYFVSLYQRTCYYLDTVVQSAVSVLEQNGRILM